LLIRENEMTVERVKPITQNLAAGAACGLVATIVMSGGFLAAQRAGTIDKLPPRLIVERFFPKLPERPARVLATVAHLAYGMAAGSVFGVLRASSRPAGVAYGVAIWAASYEAWVPAARVLPPAHRDNRSRALTILGAHVLYGAALAAARAPRTRRK
jgi:hypothetical protein